MVYVDLSDIQIKYCQRGMVNSVWEVFNYIHPLYLMVLIVCSCGLANMDTMLEGPDVSSNMTTMRGQPKDNITFIWNYNHTEPIHMIIFNRKNEKNGKVDYLGVWENGIFNQNNSRVKERVMFNKTGDLEGVIYLTLLHITAKDYNLNYTCRIVFNDRKSSSNISIFLAGGPEVSSDVTSMRGHPEDNIKLIWNYNYTVPINMIIFHRKNEKNGKIESVGFWEHGIFNPDDSRVKERVVFNKTGDLEGAIYLILLNTTAGDYNLNYTCKIVFNDKQSSSKIGIFLFGGPEIYSNETYMYGRPKENITFSWRYEHTAQIDKIILNRTNEKNGKIESVGFWEHGIFNPDDSRVKERVVFNKTGDLEGAIYLILLNTTAGDYNLNYTCTILFDDKQSSSKIGIFLFGEKEPVFVQDNSALSTGAIAGIALTVVFLFAILSIILIIVLVKRCESVRRKIRICLGRNNTVQKGGNNANQPESIPLQE